MSSPGGAVVGRVSVRVLPDTSGFRARLQAELEKINPEVKVRIVPDLDTAKLRAQLAALDLKQIKMKVDVDGVPLALAELTALEQLVDRLDGRNIRLRIDVDGLAEAIAQLAALEATLAALRASLGSINTGGGGGGGGFGIGGLGQLVQVAAIAAAIGFAGAGITAAWGAAATAIAAVPAALSLAAVPIAAIALGLDGIKKAAQTIKPEFDALKKSVSGVFETGFTQAFKTIAPLFNSVLTPGFKAVAESINGIVIGLAKMAASTDGVTLLHNIFSGVAISLDEIRPGLFDIVDSLLILGGRAQVFDLLTSAVNTFGAAFRSALIDNINNGTLDAAIGNLSGLINSLEVALVSLVHNGIEVFATAGPAVTSTIDALTNFFGKFDWQRLGAAVGDVFRGLTDAINGIPQSTIDNITGAFERMGKAFSDPAFVANLTDIGNNLPGVIDQLTTFSTEFVKAVDGIVSAVSAFDTVDQKFQTFTQTTLDSIGQIGVALGVGDGSPVSKWLNDVDDSIDRFFGIIPPKAQDLGNQTSQALATGVSANKPLVDRAAETLGNSIPTAVQTNFAGIPQIVQNALAPLPPTAQAIFLQLQPIIQGAMAGLATTAQLGFASVAAAISTGGPAMIAAVTTAFVGSDVAVTTAFQFMAVKAQEGLGLVAQAITSSFASVILPAFTAGFVSVSAQFAVLGADMSTAMAAALAGLKVTVDTGLLAISDAFFLNQQVLVAAVQVTAGLVSTAFQTMFTGLNQVVSDQLSIMLTLFQTATLQIPPMFQTAMDAVVVAVNNGMTAAQQAVTDAIAGMLASLTGAESSFFDAGSNMGGALAAGLRSRQGEVEAAAAALANAAAAAVRAAAQIHSPSRVFNALGQFVGKGFADGINTTLSVVEKAALKMSAVAAGAVKKVAEQADFSDLATKFMPAVDARTSVVSTGSSLNVDANGLGSLGDSVADALSGWTVEIDQAGIAKLVNKQNLRNRRR